MTYRWVIMVHIFLRCTKHDNMMFDRATTKMFWSDYELGLQNRTQIEQHCPIMIIFAVGKHFNPLQDYRFGFSKHKSWKLVLLKTFYLPPKRPIYDLNDGCLAMMKELLGRFSEFQQGIEHMTSITQVGGSKH